MSYTIDYAYTTDDLRGRFSLDPEEKKEWARVYAKHRTCHKILHLAKQEDGTEALCRLLESGEACLTTVYEKFEFKAWLDSGGGFVAKDVTIFQAALLQPEEYGSFQSDSISGIHTGKCFRVLLSLLDTFGIDKSILLHQDAKGKTVLHAAAFTGYNRPKNSHSAVQLILDSLATEPEIKEKLWSKKDHRGKIARDYARSDGNKRLLSVNTKAEETMDLKTAKKGPDELVFCLLL